MTSRRADEPAPAERWQQWFAWWLGAWMVLVVAIAFVLGIAEWKLHADPDKRMLSLTRVALASPTIPAEILKTACNAGGSSQRLAHLHLALWNSGLEGEDDTSSPRVVDLIAHLPAGPDGKARAPVLKWVGVTARPDKDAGDTARCRDDTIEVRWAQALGAGQGFLIEALYDIGDADAGELHVALGESHSPALAAPADGTAAAVKRTVATLDPRVSILPAPDRDVAQTRRFLMWTLWAVALLVAAAALHRAVSDAVFGLYGGAVVSAVVFVAFVAGSFWLLDHRVLLYERFPLTVLPER